MDQQESPHKSKTSRKIKVRKRSKRGMLSRFGRLVDRVNLVHIIVAAILAYIVGKMILRYTG